MLLTGYLGGYSATFRGAPRTGDRGRPRSRSRSERQRPHGARPDDVLAGGACAGSARGGRSPSTATRARPSPRSSLVARTARADRRPAAPGARRVVDRIRLRRRHAASWPRPASTFRDPCERRPPRKRSPPRTRSGTPWCSRRWACCTSPTRAAWRSGSRPGGSSRELPPRWKLRRATPSSRWSPRPVPSSSSPAAAGTRAWARCCCSASAGSSPRCCGTSQSHSRRPTPRRSSTYSSSCAARPLLTGARGRPPLAVRAAAEAAAALSVLAARHPELAEIEVNPLLVTQSAAIALDARVVHSQPR